MVSSEYQLMRLSECRREFAELQTMRNVFAQHWEEVAELVLVTSRNTFYYGSYNFPGGKKTDRQVDASAVIALDRFGAILDSLLTPRNQVWHQLESSNPYIMKNREARLWFEQATRILFKHRYSPIANFSAQNQNQYQSLGAFGTGNMFIDSYQGVDGAKGLRYKHLPLGEMFLRENHQGLIDGYCRWFRLTAQQAMKQGAKMGWEMPDSIKAAAEQNTQMPFEFLHRVCPRDDYDPGRWDFKGKLYASYYICLTTDTFLSEGGYNTFPVASSRYVQTPGEVYGRSPAMLVLPAIKTLNAEKRDFLTQGHRAVAPVLLTADDGLTDFSMRPDALNKGGMSSDGHPLVGVLPTGDINVSKEMMDEERALIDSAFLVDLFKILLGDPKIYTATQITEMMAQRGVLIAPTVGRQQSEYLGPLIDRELDVLAEQKLLPPMPGILREAKGDYHVVYTSPLARDMRAQEVAGAMRTVDMAIQVANASGDPSVFDRFNFDKIIADSADIQGMPASWLASDDEVAQKQKARAQMQERQAQAQEAPAQAALMKAGAAQKQAGMKPGQLGPETGPVQAPAQQQ
jgi:hypothetical protein